MATDTGWLFIKERLVSRSFIALFVTATNFYLFDVFLEAYAKNALSITIQEKISSVFANGIVVGIYLGSFFEALAVSASVGVGVSLLRRAIRKFR